MENGGYAGEIFIQFGLGLVQVRSDLIRVGLNLIHLPTWSRSFPIWFKSNLTGIILGLMWSTTDQIKYIFDLIRDISPDVGPDQFHVQYDLTGVRDDLGQIGIVLNLILYISGLIWYVLYLIDRVQVGSDLNNITHDLKQVSLDLNQVSFDPSDFILNQVVCQVRQNSDRVRVLRPEPNR